MNRNANFKMSIESMLENLMKEIKETGVKLRMAQKEYKMYSRAQKRAKNDPAKENIQRENLAPIHRKIQLLKMQQKKTLMKIRAIESYVLEEELETRQSGALTSIQDDRRFKYLFTRFRRFGNFNGYLAGRKAEADNELKEYFITQKVNRFIKDTGKDELCEKYEINPKSKSWLTDLRYAIVDSGEIELGDLDEDIKEFKGSFINENTVFARTDRRRIIEQLQKGVPKKEPKTPLLDLLNDSIEDEEREDEEPEGPEGPDLF